MKLKKIYSLLLFFGVLTSSWAQSLEDFPWVIDILTEDNCCNNESVTVYKQDSHTFVYIAVDATCTDSESKLYSENGVCWCTDYAGTNCLATYDLLNASSTPIYNCKEENEYDVFKEYSWLNEVVAQGDCCANQLIEVIDLNTFAFIYISSKSACSKGKLFYETGELFCSDASDYDCLLAYGFSNDKFKSAWTCGSETTNLDCMPTWYADTDGNGLGNPANSLTTCEQPIGYVADNSDNKEAAMMEVAASRGTSSRSFTPLTVDCESTYTLANTTYTDEVTISVSGTMESAAIHTNSSNTTYKAGTSILLTAGFEVVEGSTFSATIEACEACTALTWCQDLDGDGLGNPAVSLSACEQPSGYVSDCSDTDDSGGSSSPGSTPVSAFNDFNTDGVMVSFDGDEITIESNGLPNHTSPYWATTNSLYIDPVVANSARMSPGAIREGSYTLTVPASPEKAATTSSTGLGAIGISVTGAPIFNDEEGPNISLSANVASGFDYAGGHSGPTGYHYHLESSNVAENTTLSYDDEKLVGILNDGFLLYGRKCNSTGNHPTDLDASGGHTSSTQHSNGDEFYHYHIINEVYISPYILLFGVDLQGTPNNIL